MSLAIVEDAKEFIEKAPKLFPFVPKHYPQDAILNVVLLPVKDLLCPSLYKRRDSTWKKTGENGCPDGLDLSFHKTSICHWEGRGFQIVPFLKGIIAIGFDGVTMLEEEALNPFTIELLRNVQVRQVLEKHTHRYIIGIKQAPCGHFHGSDVGFVSGSSDEGETPVDCLVREFAEETSLTASFPEHILTFKRRFGHVDREPTGDDAVWEILRFHRGRKDVHVFLSGVEYDIPSAHWIGRYKAIT